MGTLRVSRKQAFSLLQNMQTAYSQLADYMGNLHDDLVIMNRKYWYGGDSANKQYNKLKAYYENNIKYMAKMEKVIKRLRKYVTKGKGL